MRDDLLNTATTSASPITHVSDTSYWVAYYRAKESARPDALFQDPLAKVLIGDLGKKIADSMPQIGRYTEWSVVSRTVIIDRFIETLIKEGIDTVLNLGAGLDTRPYRMKLPDQLNWIEVDYAHIIDHKTNLLAKENPVCKLNRVKLNLAERPVRTEFFKTVASESKKVLVLTEGVIPYLSPDQVSELAEDLLAVPAFQFWITEYFDPRVYPYLKGTVRAAKMKNAPFLFYPDDWFGFFRRHGWVQKSIGFSGEIALEFKRTPPMPLIARLIMPLLPMKVRQSSMRMAGHVVLKRDPLA